LVAGNGSLGAGSLLTVVVECRDPRRQAEILGTTADAQGQPAQPWYVLRGKLPGRDAILLVAVMQYRIRRLAMIRYGSPSGSAAAADQLTQGV